MANIIGSNGNDTLESSYDADTINGLAGNDTIIANNGNDTLTGGGGKDKFFFDLFHFGTDIISDFDGVGKGTNPTAAVISEIDTLTFSGNGLTAQNLLLTQNGNNLEISFERDVYETRFYEPSKVILQNFALENLDNLSKSTGATVDLGNILFNGQTSITDSFDVFNANSSQSTIFKKNTVTFLNDLDNNVSGFDNSDDVINGQGGDDIINGLSGNDLLRGGAGNNLLNGGDGNDSLSASGIVSSNNGESYRPSGNNTLNGGAGDDNLSAYASVGDNLLNGGNGNDSLSASSFLYSNDSVSLDTSGNNTLNGGAGDDNLSAYASTGDNLLNGDDGNDFLSASGIVTFLSALTFLSSGNNTLNGGAGDDNLNAYTSTGDNLLNGGDGNDSLFANWDFYIPMSVKPTGNNTLNGDAGNDYLNVDGSTGDNLLDGGDANDTLRAEYSAGNNLLSGGDGNDFLSASSTYSRFGFFLSSGNNTLYGGAGDDALRAEYSTGNNLLSGDDGNDSLSISGRGLSYAFSKDYYDTTGNNTLNGGAGDDTLRAEYSAGNNLLSGGDGNDSFYVSTPYAAPSYLVTQTVDGGIGDDLVSLDYSNATGGITTTFNATTNIGEITAGTKQVSYKNIERLNISGTAYDDLIVGNDGNDTLFGGYGNGSYDTGNDTIIGGAGNDYLSVSYLGDNTLYGGDGNDTFAFNGSYYNEGFARIYDFNATNELIQILTSNFGGSLSTGSLSASQFTLGTSATTSNQRFIYNFTTGALYFDQDGSASGFTQVKFAQLSTGLSLTENNFVII